MSDAERLLEDLRAAGTDPAAVDRVLDDLQHVMGQLGPEDARQLYEVMQDVTETLQSERARLRTQMGGVNKRGRAIRGFGRANVHTTFMRGQRVNTDI